ncbi:hypothetical protein GW17_00006491, partial [Ensete ventricosum]
EGERERSSPLLFLDLTFLWFGAEANGFDGDRPSRCAIFLRDRDQLGQVKRLVLSLRFLTRFVHYCLDEMLWIQIFLFRAFMPPGVGIFSGVTLALYPLSVIKTRMQVASKDAVQKNVFSAFRNIVKVDGIPGLYRGFGTVITGAVPARIVFLTSLEMTKEASLKLMEPFKLSEPVQAAIANGIAGMSGSLCSQAVFVPLDVLLINSNENVVDSLEVMVTTEKRDVGHVMKRLIAEDGWRGLYRGLGPRFASMSAWGTTTIVAYEYLSKKILPSSRMIALSSVVTDCCHRYQRSCLVASNDEKVHSHRNVTRLSEERIVDLIVTCLASFCICIDNDTVTE